MSGRSLRSLPAHGDPSAFRAIALGPTLPRILSGSEAAVAVDNISEFAVGGPNPKAAPISNTFEAMYAHSVDSVLHGTGQETFDATLFAGVSLWKGMELWANPEMDQGFGLSATLGVAGFLYFGPDFRRYMKIRNM